MPANIEIRLLGPSDAEIYRAIRLKALLTAPEAFGSVHALEAARPIEHFEERLKHSQVFGAFAGADIAGMIGFKQQSGPKDAHKGIVWGFFVDPAHRKSGVGAALMAAALQAARCLVEQVTLTVADTNSPAIRLYQRFGFIYYGLEPRALKTPSGYTDEVLMVVLFDGFKPTPFC